MMVHEWEETPAGLWMALARYGKDGNRIGPRFLAIRLIEGDAWKDMDESVGPYADDCPERVFDAADPLPDETPNYAADCRCRIMKSLGRPTPSRQ